MGEYTIENYFSLKPNGDLWELIKGIFKMSPAPAPRHQKIAGRIYVDIENHVAKHKKYEVFISPFDVIFDKHTVVQPDIVIIGDMSKLTHRGYQGAPDVVIEVVSPSSHNKDLLEKHSLYQEHGVKEYLIVYPATHEVWQYVLEDEGRFSPPMKHSMANKINVSYDPDLILDLSYLIGEELP